MRGSTANSFAQTCSRTACSTGIETEREGNQDRPKAEAR